MIKAILLSAAFLTAVKTMKSIDRDKLNGRRYYSLGPMQSTWTRFFIRPTQYTGGQVHPIAYKWKKSQRHPTTFGQHDRLPNQSGFTSDAHVFTHESQVKLPRDNITASSNNAGNRVYKEQMHRSRAVYRHKA